MKKLHSVLVLGLLLCVGCDKATTSEPPRLGPELTAPPPLMTPPSATPAPALRPVPAPVPAPVRRTHADVAAFHAVERSLPAEGVSRVSGFFGWSDAFDRYIDLRLQPGGTFVLRAWHARQGATLGRVGETMTGAWRWDEARQSLVLDGAGEGTIDFTARAVRLTLTAPIAASAQFLFMTFVPEYVPQRNGAGFSAIARVGEILQGRLRNAPPSREIELPERIAFALGLPTRTTAGALRAHLFDGYNFRPSIPILLLPDDTIQLLATVGE